jgi:hypothetical protein
MAPAAQGLTLIESKVSATHHVDHSSDSGLEKCT